MLTVNEGVSKYVPTKHHVAILTQPHLYFVFHFQFMNIRAVSAS